ncbi:MAG: hypothetical protein ACMXYL_03165 [Candidatus Woesearchaeota archaeon]
MKGNVKQTMLLATLGLMLIVSAAAFAVAQPWAPGPKANYDEDVHIGLRQAMENLDFEEWKRIRVENGLPMRGRMMAEMDEERFGHFVAMHAAYHVGDYERAKTIRDELRERVRQNPYGNGLQKGRVAEQHRYRTIVSVSSE